MLGLDNAEEVLQILERYTKLKSKDIPQELDEYLNYVAKTGDPVYRWSTVQYFFREKLITVIKDFHDTTPSIEDLPQCPNVDEFNYESLKTALLERLELFHAAPFTIQRLCELLTDPRKHYCRLDKFMRALEKNILVVSTIEPGRKQVDSENGDSMNGDAMLDVNVDVEMDKESSSSSTSSSVDHEDDESIYKSTISASQQQIDTDSDLFNDVETSDEAKADENDKLEDEQQPSLQDDEMSPTLTEFDVVPLIKEDCAIDSTKLIDIDDQQHRETNGNKLSENVADDSDDLHINVVDVVKENKDVDLASETRMNDEPQQQCDDLSISNVVSTDTVADHHSQSQQQQIDFLEDIQQLPTNDEKLTTPTIEENAETILPCLDEIPVEAIVVESTNIGTVDDHIIDNNVITDDAAGAIIVEKDCSEEIDECSPKSAKIQRMNDAVDTNDDLLSSSLPIDESAIETNIIDCGSVLPITNDTDDCKEAQIESTPIESIISAVAVATEIDSSINDDLVPINSENTSGIIEPVPQQQTNDEIIDQTPIITADDIDLGHISESPVLPTIDESSLEMLPDTDGLSSVIVPEIIFDAAVKSPIVITDVTDIIDQNDDLSSDVVVEPTVPTEVPPPPPPSTTTESTTQEITMPPSQIEINEISTEPLKDEQPQSQQQENILPVIEEPTVAATTAVGCVSEEMAIEENVIPTESPNLQLTSTTIEENSSSCSSSSTSSSSTTSSSAIANIENTAMESTPIIPSVNEDEQMEVDESNSIDSMDL